MRTELAKQHARLILWITGLFGLIAGVVKAFKSSSDSEWDRQVFLKHEVL